MVVTVVSNETFASGEHEGGGPVSRTQMYVSCSNDDDPARWSVVVVDGVHLDSHIDTCIDFVSTHAQVKGSDAWTDRVRFSFRLAFIIDPAGACVHVTGIEESGIEESDLGLIFHVADPDAQVDPDLSVELARLVSMSSDQRVEAWSVWAEVAEILRRTVPR